MRLLNEEFVKHIDNLKILYDYLVRCKKRKNFKLAVYM